MLTQVTSPWTPKLLWLLVPSFGAATLWWFVISRTLQGEVGFTTATLPNLLLFIVFGIFALGLWFGTLGLIGYMTRVRSVQALSALIVTVPIAVWFPFDRWTGIAAAVTFVALWWGIERLTADQHNRLTVRPQLTLSTFSIAVTMVLIAVSLLYYQQLRGSSRTTADLAEHLAGQSVSIAERFLPMVYKEYRPTQTVDEFLLSQFPTADEILNKINLSGSASDGPAQAQIRDQLSQHNLNPDRFSVQGQASQDQIREQLVKELDRQRVEFLADAKQRLVDQLGISFRGDEPMHDVLTRLVNKQFEQSVRRYVEIIPWLLAAALFFVLNVFAGVFTVAIGWIGWAVFRLYRSLHILKVDHEMVPSEKVVWF